MRSLFGKLLLGLSLLLGGLALQTAQAQLSPKERDPDEAYSGYGVELGVRNGFFYEQKLYGGLVAVASLGEMIHYSVVDNSEASIFSKEPRDFAAYYFGIAPYFNAGLRYYLDPEGNNMGPYFGLGYIHVLNTWGLLKPNNWLKDVANSSIYTLSAGYNLELTDHWQLKMAFLLVGQEHRPYSDYSNVGGVGFMADIGLIYRF